MATEGMLYTSSITKNDGLKMGKAYMESYAIGIINEQDRLAYVDLKTHPHNHTCSICGEEYFGWGHNAKPVVEDARCCAKCNAKIVLPARIRENGGGRGVFISSSEEMDALAEQSNGRIYNASTVMEMAEVCAKEGAIVYPHGYGSEAA